MSYFKVQYVNNSSWTTSKKPLLNENLKAKHLEFTKNTMTWSNKWFKFVFSDRKMLNIDGQDKFNFYFQDLKREKILLQQGQRRESGVMR